MSLVRSLAPLPNSSTSAATAAGSSSAAATATPASATTTAPATTQAGDSSSSSSSGADASASSGAVGSSASSSDSLPVPSVDNQLVPGAPDDEGHAPKGEHALHQPWTFWYDVADMNTGGKKGDWGASLKKLLEFNSVEQFWGMLNNVTRPSNLPMKSDYHLFRFGIKPEWEDPQTRNGGKWVWEMKSAPAEQIDTAWLHTLLFLIGEQFSDESEVLGAVISLRKGNRSRLALWTRSASAREVLTRVGNEWRKQLPVSNAVKIAFYSHAQSIKSSSRELTPIYTV